MRALSIAIVVLVTLAGTSHAEPEAQREPLSEGTALALSVGGTVASWGLLIASTRLGGESERDRDTAATLFAIGGIASFVTPSLGHLYARRYVTRGLGIRAVGLAAMVFGGAEALDDRCDSDNPSSCHRERGELVLLLGLVTYIGGTLDDLITAPSSVRRFNRRHEITIAPMVGSNSTGVAVGGRF